MERERILIEDGEFTCLCGNTSISDGFYPRDSHGVEVEPTLEGDWGGATYVCARCGRIIDQLTGEVLGQNEATPST